MDHLNCTNAKAKRNEYRAHQPKIIAFQLMQMNNRNGSSQSYIRSRKTQRLEDPQTRSHSVSTGNVKSQRYTLKKLTVEMDHLDRTYAEAKRMW